MTTTTKIKPTQILAWIVSLGIPLIISFIPTNEQFTPTMRTFLVISVMAILMIAFENIPQAAITFLLPAAYIVFGVCDANIAFSSWTMPTFWMIIGALLLVDVLSTSGLLTRISYTVLKYFGESYTKILISLAIIGTILNVILFGNGCVLLAALAYGLCKALDIKPLSREGTGIFLTAAISAIIPSVFSYGSNLFMIQAYWSSVIQTNIGFAEFTFFMIPFYIYFALAVLLIILMFRSKKDMNSKIYAAKELNKLGKMSMLEIKAVIWLIIIFSYVIFCGIVGRDSTMAFIITPGLMLFPVIGCGNGENVKNLDFTFILFVASCMSIGFVAASLGFGELITTLAAPALDDTTPTIYTIFMYWLNVLLNFLLTPMAIMAGFTSTLTQIAVNLGLNPMVVYGVESLGLDQILFPYEYALYMLFFSFGFVSMKEFVRYFGIKMVLGFLCLILIFIPFWKLTGVFMM